MERLHEDVVLSQTITFAPAKPLVAPTEALREQIMSVFHYQRPTESELATIADVAKVAASEVIDALNLDLDDARAKTFLDFAEVAALYGYVVGRENAQTDGGQR